MLAEGLNVVEFSKLMGHQDLKTTMKYLHPDASSAAAIVNRRNWRKSLHFFSAAG